MGRQIRPAKVFETVTREIEHRVLDSHRVAEPAWYKTVGRIPPAETIVRTIPPRQHAPRGKGSKPKNLYRPQEISYVEDKMRRRFFKDHPWELARPRIVLETDGKDHQRCDWSKGLQQPGIPLTGECVIQRQLWLQENAKMSRNAAYDKARHEFYRLRQAEEVERRVAIEEARYVGGYFGHDRIDISMHLENREFEAWKAWAQEEMTRAEQRMNSQVETFDVEEDVAADPLAEPEAETAKVALPA